MSLKRRNTSSPEPDASPISKRQRYSLEEDSDASFEHPISSEQPRSDPTYGQKGAFPGLDGDDDELFYGPPTDGLEYLRIVRSEAKGVPHLLVAPRAPLIDHDLAEHGMLSDDPDDAAGGYYADGAYTAAPDTGFRSSSHHGPPDAQDLYYESLSARFKLLHATLKCSPSHSAIEALDSSTLISLPPDTESAQSQWRLHLQSSDPITVQLACIDSETVLEVIKILTGTMAQTVRSRGRDRLLRFGAWVWGVLGKCPDRTELGSEEIAVLRELGKRAVGVLVGIRAKSEKDSDAEQDTVERETENGQVGEEVEGKSILPDELKPGSAPADCPGVNGTFTQEEHRDIEGLETNEQGAAALEAAKRRLENAFLATDDIQNPSVDIANGQGDNVLGVDTDTDTAKHNLGVDRLTRITLDMILTIVGESYGQRDLLEFRDIWEEY